MSGIRHFQVERPAFSKYYDLKWPDGQPAFYCELSQFTPNKPHLTLHSGHDESAPVVAAAFLGGFASSTIQLGLGSPADPRGVHWEDMGRTSLFSRQYDFTMNLPAAADGAPASRRGYMWQRSAMSDYKLVDAQTGNVVAGFSREMGFSRCGQLFITESRGPAFDFMVVISFLSIYETAKRKKRRRAANGAAF